MIRWLGLVMVVSLGAWAAFGQGVGEERAKPGAKDAERPKPAVRVKLVRVRVLKPTAEQRRAARDRRGSWNAPGTQLTLVATTIRGSIIGMHETASKLRTLSDDLGNDLRWWRHVKPPKRRRDEWLQPGDQPGERYRFQIAGLDVPADGASTIKLDAEVVFVRATRLKTVAAKDVKLTPGTKVGLGLTQMEIVGMSKARRDRYGEHAFGLKYTEKDDALGIRIKDIRFYNGQGKHLTLDRGGWVLAGEHGDQRIQYYQVEQKLEKITIELTYWEDARDVRVPLDIDIGVGF